MNFRLSSQVTPVLTGRKNSYRDPMRNVKPGRSDLFQQGRVFTVERLRLFPSQSGANPATGANAATPRFTTKRHVYQKLMKRF
jgi:hypothetical protein